MTLVDERSIGSSIFWFFFAVLIASIGYFGNKIVALYFHQLHHQIKQYGVNHDKSGKAYSDCNGDQLN